MNQIMMVVKQFNCTVVQQDMQLFCLMTIGIPKNREDDVLYRLRDMQGVEVVKVIA
jgi:hypothetical protein